MHEALKQKIRDYQDKTGKRLIYFGKNAITTDTLVSKSDEFRTTSLYGEIMEATNFLPESTTLYDRERCIFQNVSEVPHCEVCGRPISIKPANRFNAPCFGTAHVCENKSCAAKYASDSRKPCSDNTKKLHAESRLSNLRHFEEMFCEIAEHANDHADISQADLETCSSFCRERIEAQHRNKPVFKLTDSVVHSAELEVLLQCTKFIPIDSDSEKKSMFKRLRLDERAYCLINELTSQPKCELCGRTLPFIRVSAGYLKNCGSMECLAEKVRLRHGMKKLSDYRADIDETKFDVIHFPANVTIEKLVVRCKRCGTVSEWDVADGRLKTLHHNRLCRACDRWTSTGEIELADFIINSLPEDERHLVMRNCRSIITPLELDIYVPSRKIAFEFDGIFWHSESNSHNTTYHLNKTKRCEELGIHLIHVFENEWENEDKEKEEQRRDIVRTRIVNALHRRAELLHPAATYRSSKLALDESVGHDEALSFLEKFHIQGCGNMNVQTVRLGLKNDEDKLISLMTFAKCKKGSKTEWELTRFCSDPNYVVFGAAGRLLKRFEEKYTPKSIVSYADRRWTMNNGNAVYDKLGFRLDHVSAPNYWYWKRGKSHVPELKSRLNFQKHKLKSVLEHFDPSMSESQNMAANGYDRIFDCGNLVYVKEYDI